MKNIDLAMDYGGPMEPMPMKAPEKHYPSFTYDGSTELDLPDSGVMTIRFKEIRREESSRNGVERYSCTVEVQQIISVKPDAEPPAKTDKSASDALDELMAAKEAESADEDAGEPGEE